jgi:hypothetical protein
LLHIYLCDENWSELYADPLPTTALPRIGESLTYKGVHYVVTGVWHEFDEDFYAVALMLDS